MRLDLVKVPSPRVNLALGVSQIQEPIHVEALVTEPAVERFHKRIVGRLARAEKVERGSVDGRPMIDRLQGELGVVVDPDLIEWFTPLEQLRSAT